MVLFEFRKRPKGGYVVNVRKYFGKMLVLGMSLGLAIGARAEDVPEEPPPPPPTFFETLEEVGTLAEYGWLLYVGDENDAKMIDVFDSGDLVLGPTTNDAFLAISPQSNGGITVYQELLDTKPGDRVEVDWAMFYTDTLPYIDSGFIYVDDTSMDETIQAVFTTIFDGNSSWRTSSFIVPGEGPLWVVAGAMNGLDNAVAPIFMVGDVRLVPALVPIPAPILLLGTAVVGLVSMRRRAPS